MLPTGFPKTFHVFCHVVDNFGDIGVCWRLTRQLANEHEMLVVLWVDDLFSLKKICSDVDPSQREQEILGVTVRDWPADIEKTAVGEVADVVIEAFGCQLPAIYIDAMAKKPIAPVWINLEYLSAEEWVEGCHQLASPQSALPLNKYFFFPGFTDRTGGLLRERELFARRTAFQENPAAISGFLASLGVIAPPHACKISLFSYSNAPVKSFFEALATDTDHPALCLVPEGVAAEAVSEFLGKPAKAGASAERGGLTVHVLPFVDQDDYDKLLWSCDLNFVRGEDSFVRAQWAARPFVWHIYPQEERAHLVKLNAFLRRYETVLTDDQVRIVNVFWQSWNASEGEAFSENANWTLFRSILPDLRRIGPDWARQLSHNGDLVSSLIQFIRRLG